MWRSLLLLSLTLAQTAFHTDPFQPLEDYAPAVPPSRTPLGSPSPAYWQNRADYQMEITIDPKTHRLRGIARLTYTHNGPFPICRLWLAIEPNYFSLSGLGHLSRNFLWEDFRRDAQRGKANRTELYARQLENYQRTDFTLTEVAIEEGSSARSLPYRLQETLMEVSLPKCLSTGEHTTLRLQWTFILNDALVEGRSGYMMTERGPIYQIAQYYPRPVLLNDIRGWEKMPHYGPSEFATEFGDYEVTVRIPKGYIVGATGRLLNPENVLAPVHLERWKKVSADSTTFILTAKELPLKVEKDTLSWRFRAENVRDFAFAASNQYAWEARYTHVPGAPQPTLIQALYTPEVAPLWEHLALGAAEHAIHEYSRYTFPFPYPTMTVSYGGVYGMEYPMIVFCGRQQPEKNGKVSESLRHSFVSLVIHEVGHNFFPMIVCSDERRWMWLDEGLNTYLENRSKGTFEPRMQESDLENERRRLREYLASGRSQSILAHPLSIREMGANAYIKVAIGLETLREYILSPALMDTAFQRYARTWAFKHPEPWDFFRSISVSVPQELGWFWKGWFLDTASVDIAIDTVVQQKISIDRHYQKVLLAEETQAVETYLHRLARDTARIIFYVEKRPHLLNEQVKANLKAYQQTLMQRKKALTEAEAKASKYLRDNDEIYQVRVSFRNQGRMVWPLWIRLTYQSGARSLWYFPAEVWAKEPRYLVKVFHTRKPVQQIEIDPWGVSLDIQPENQTYGSAGGD